VTLYHGGVAGLHAGALLLPSPPHVSDGCPVCVARAEGRLYTAGEYRLFLRQFGDRARPVLDALAGAPDSAPLDPPSAQQAVYVTTSELYASWYAARSQGDVYVIKPIGRLTPSAEDHFSSFTVPRARVLQVLRRRVQLSDSERAQLLDEWTKADEQASGA